MATKFNEKGFSAVAAFFGKEGGESRAEKSLINRRGGVGDDARKVLPPKRGGNRLGLGASSSRGESGVLDGGLADAKKQILGVGRKNRRCGRHEPDDDASGGETDKEGDSSDEDDEGRTLAVKQPKPNETVEGEGLRETSCKKRKKKKKKGGLEQLQQVATHPIPFEDNEKPHPIKVDSAKAQSDDAAANRKGSEGAADAAPRKVRKRRKVRSRQKNIRKDHRSDSEKPAHLVPGSQVYAGRSLTRETRERLNLPDSKTCSRHTRMVKNIDKDAVAAPVALRSGDGGFDSGLVIDDYLDIGGAAGESQEPMVKQSEKKPSREKKKRKRQQ